MTLLLLLLTLCIGLLAGHSPHWFVPWLRQPELSDEVSIACGFLAVCVGFMFGAMFGVIMLAIVIT